MVTGLGNSDKPNHKSHKTSTQCNSSVLASKLVADTRRRHPDKHKLDDHLIKGLVARGVVAVITTIYRLDIYSIDTSIIQVCMGTDPTGQQFACLFDTGAEISIMNSNGPQFERMENG